MEAGDVRPSLSSCLARKVKKVERRQTGRGHRSDCLPWPWSQGFGEYVTVQSTCRPEQINYTASLWGRTPDRTARRPTNRPSSNTPWQKFIEQKTKVGQKMVMPIRKKSTRAKCVMVTCEPEVHETESGKW